MKYVATHLAPLSLIQFAQAALVSELYPAFSVQLIRDEKVVVNFSIEDKDLSECYDIQIDYVSPWEHKVFILKPVVLPFYDIHMYSDGSLCLYYPYDISPLDRVSLALHLIRWTYRWVYSFEIWKVNGYIWPHDFVPHNMHSLTSYVQSDVANYSLCGLSRRPH